VRWSSASLDGDVYAQPLVVGNSIFVATQNDSIYALDALTGKVRWRTNVGRSIPQSQLPCGNVDPTGILGTPVIDPDRATIYALAYVQPGAHELVALDTRDGHLRWKRTMDPPAMDVVTQQQRTSLLLSHGKVYAGFGGLYGDCGQYKGWVVSVASSGNGALDSYVTPTSRGGAIWATGAPMEAGGRIYVSTGNSFDAQGFDYSDSVLALAPDLHRTDHFTPSNWIQLNETDADLASIEPVPVDGMLFQSGKDGNGYLVDASEMGGIGGEISQTSVCAGAFGSPAVFGATVYLPCIDGLFAVNVEGRQLATAWHQGLSNAGPPVVGAGWVWTIAGSGDLVAFDAVTGERAFLSHLGTVAHFASPALSRRCLYAPSLRNVRAFCS
jgi:outer membrane protein assembly factor BamB